MTDPRCWYIYLHDWVIYGANVGKYSSTMDPMGKEAKKQPWPRGFHDVQGAVCLCDVPSQE